MKIKVSYRINYPQPRQFGVAKKIDGDYYVLTTGQRVHRRHISIEE